MSDDSMPPIPPQASMPPPPPTGSSAGDDTVMLILAYLGIFALIPLLVEKNKPNVQWHAKHGLVLAVTWFILFTILGVVSTVLTFVPFVGCLGWVLISLASVGVLVLHIMCILKAIKGERMLIPHLSEYADRF